MLEIFLLLEEELTAQELNQILNMYNLEYDFDSNILKVVKENNYIEFYLEKINQLGNPMDLEETLNNYTNENLPFNKPFMVSVQYFKNKIFLNEVLKKLEFLNKKIFIDLNDDSSLVLLSEYNKLN